jgi:phosphonate transport system substrate-binding protein
VPSFIQTRLASLAVLASLALSAAACAPAAPSPTTAPAKPAATAVPAKPAEAPAVKPAEAKPAPSTGSGQALSKAEGPVASPVAATKPAEAKPAASPAAKAEAKPTEKAAARPAGPVMGTRESPLKMAFVPSQDSQKVLASGQPLAELLTKETGLYFEVSVPTSYTAVIEAMGASKVDIGWLAPFAYVLAHDKHGAEVILSSVRQGSKTYRSQIIAHADSGITSLEQLRGKKFAFVDNASASGFLFPNALLASKGIDYKTFFSETLNAGGHDKVVIAVYNKQVDAGATFGNSLETGAPTDARTLVATTLPDVMDKVKPIAVTDPIPNDTVSVRKGLDADAVKKVQTGLLQVAKSPDGQNLLRALYNINGLAEATDKDYDPVRSAASVLKLDLEEQIKPR